MLLPRRRLKDRAPGRAMHQHRFGPLRRAGWLRGSVTSRLRMKQRFDGEISLCPWIEFGCGAGASLYGLSPATVGAPPKLQGERVIAWPPAGAAARIGSTPPRTVIAVAWPVVVPSVATIITASSFLKSARVAAGMRFTIC